VECWSIFIYFK